MFTRAVKHDSKARVALIGPPGSGKTYTALQLATQLSPGGRIAVVDTEHGSAEKYADVFSFDQVCPDSYSPDSLPKFIKAASDAGYDALIIDSLSHFWMGKDGALEYVDNAAKRQAARSGSNKEDSFGAWREFRPHERQQVEEMLRANLHVIVTMRTKVEYVRETNEKGKTVIRKVGLQPIQRDGLEYEFDIVGDLDIDNNLVVTKSRCSKLAGGVFAKPGADFADTLKAWLRGEKRPEPTNGTPKVDQSQAFADLKAQFAGLEAEWTNMLRAFGVSDPSEFQDRTIAAAAYQGLKGILRKLQNGGSQPTPKAQQQAPESTSGRTVITDADLPEILQPGNAPEMQKNGTVVIGTLRPEHFDADEYGYLAAALRASRGFNKAKLDHFISTFAGTKDELLDLAGGERVDANG